MIYPVVFLPGTLCDDRVFASQRQSLTQAGVSSKVITFRLETNVKQMADRILAEAPAEQFVLCAFSMGAMAAFEFCRQHPERVSGLVLLAANAHADLPGRAELRAQQLAEAQTHGMAWLIRERCLPNYLNKQQSEHQQLIVAMAEDLGLEVFAAQLAILASRPSAYSVLAEVTVPTLIIAGENDLLCPPAEQQRMQQSLKHSELHLLPACGHFVSLEGAHLLQPILLPWLRSLK